jgi:hypothetical protein
VKTFRLRIQIAALVLSLIPALAVAQKQDEWERDKREQGEHQERVLESCKEARKILVGRRVNTAERWVFAHITTCPGASEVLAAAWAHPPTKADLLRDLVGRSGGIADRRILNAALTAMQAAPLEAQRRAALSVVLTQYNPSVAMTTWIWDNPENTILANVSDYYQVPGEHPITAADRQQVVDLFQQLSTTASTQQWRRVAALVARDLPRRRIP